MRWEQQTVERDGAARLPGVGGTVIRTFDAPETLSTRFHEIHARTALNHVPKPSRVPFAWTINPYRGCTHACVFCLAPDTDVLLADGRTRRIEDLRPGDAIYGTRREGRYRRYVKTQVLAQWATRKPAYRITLADGTGLVASGDHRFLTRRGWKYVTGTEQGTRRRPHLTVGSELLGVGGFSNQPFQGADYREGYLCGMVRGDARLTRPGAARSAPQRFRLALVDLEGLRRAKRYLASFDVPTKEFLFQDAMPGYRPIRAVRAQSRALVERVHELVEWPAEPTLEWCRGFLAGIFDAEGSCSGGVLRISNCDPEILRWTHWCLRDLGFDAVLERTPQENGLCTIRVRGGLRERLRFFHSVDPAITRKRDIEGAALKSDAPLDVVSIEPLGRAMKLYDITTGTGDFIANGVVSHNCFARPTHEFLDMDAGRDFEREIVVKVNVPEVLRAELAKPSWKREHVALGTNTDPYQWVEKRYRLMRGIWEAMRDFANPCSILTKSPLVLRDADLLEQVAEVTTVTACLSVPTLDEGPWRATEPHTPHPRARLEAVAELNRRGIPTGVLIAPLIPGINDDPKQVEAVLAACADAGAVSVGGQTLFLRGSVKDVFMEWLQGYRPDLVPLYEELYGRSAYASPEARKRIEAPLRRGGWGRERVMERFRRTGSAASVATGLDGAPGGPAPAADGSRTEQLSLL